jgi:predicted RNA binding protein YcfA (HicA-like mRNA interferase family)
LTPCAPMRIIHPSTTAEGGGGLEFREVERRLRDDGWYEDRTRGSHVVFLHPDKPGHVVVPKHRGDLKKGTLRSIEKQSGVRLL